MKKTQRQSQVSVSQPPSVGPTMGPIITPLLQIAIAEPCCSRGQVSSMMACESGTRNAPNAPCATRYSTISSSDAAIPHSIDATVNPAMAMPNSRRRPNRPARNPVGGMKIAAVTM